MNILVSAIGGDIGLSIGRILHNADMCSKVIGCDIHNELFASDIFSSTHVLPRVESPYYIGALKDLVREHSVDIFIPSSEAELRWLACNPDTTARFGATCIMANDYAMEIGFDKYKTAQHVKSLGLRAPCTSLVSDLPNGPAVLPCILKNRIGSGNSMVYYIDDRSKCSFYSALYPGFIWQEYIPDFYGEYTCCVYRCLDDSIRIIVMRRRLSSGVTSYAQVVNDPSINRLCKELAISLNLRGSINIQLRLDQERNPVVFEINPRFSSTVGMRHYIGFCDLIWSIEEQYKSILASKAPDVYPNARFARRYQELLISEQFDCKSIDLA